ncbi:(2Fe-2S)-binding protein [Paenibacillus sp. GSMTC-2017]|uniref:(2Fe-2S)-binding protein n=1 Tax=Paenibacillus sp. GSMTC-2017 TaxID=2794350 RepID=UPI0018D6FB67|nr:(2Fe-2S)-binding protein [Paenibacillus sp. GSMTC-2017]
MDRGNDLGDCCEAIPSLLSSRYYLHLSAKTKIDDSITAEGLLSHDNMRLFVDHYCSLIEGLDREAAAVSLAGWFTGAALAIQHMLSVHNHILKFELADMRFFIERNESAFPEIRCHVNEWTISNLPLEKMSHEQQRYNTLAHAYGQLLAPLLRVIAKVSGSSVRALWGQVLAALHDACMLWKQEIQHSEQITTIINDFDTVVSGLDGALFQLKRNPLNIPLRYVKSLDGTKEDVLLKPSCCLYYRIEAGQYCFVCPRITEKARTVMREAFQKEKG